MIQRSQWWDLAASLKGHIRREGGIWSLPSRWEREERCKGCVGLDECLQLMTKKGKEAQRTPAFAACTHTAGAEMSEVNGEAPLPSGETPWQEIKALE